MDDDTKQTFEFVDDFSSLRAPGLFVVRLGGRLQRKRDLMHALAEGLKFPAYFGHNWDALEECLSDLSWLSNCSGVVLIHKCLPLANDEQRRTYVAILRNAQARQRLPMRVIFPQSARAMMELSN